MGNEDLLQLGFEAPLALPEEVAGNEWKHHSLTQFLVSVVIPDAAAVQTRRK